MTIIIIGSMPDDCWLARPLIESVIDVSIAVSCGSLPPARDDTREAPPDTCSRSAGSMAANVVGVGMCLGMGESFVEAIEDGARDVPRTGVCAIDGLRALTSPARPRIAYASRRRNDERPGRCRAVRAC